MLTNKSYLETRNWLYRNARPLDIARWNFHFENGSREAVLTALSAYQNSDGGFGHGLEPDAWNPNSAPIQTWAGTEILREIAFTDRQHPIINGVLEYLDNGAEFNEKIWNNTDLSNNDYPHAPWWHTNSESTCHTNYNPTACLAGFALCYADPNSTLYKRCEIIVVEAIDKFLDEDFLDDMHTGLCYVRLMEYCEQAGILDLFNMSKFKLKLIEQVKVSITADTSLWETSYICKPSQYFNSPNSIFYSNNKETADYECEYIVNSRNAAGVWDITWSWSEYPKEWAITENWWKGNLVIINMLYLKKFAKLQVL